jgi:hypothetical protein
MSALLQEEDPACPKIKFNSNSSSNTDYKTNRIINFTLTAEAAIASAVLNSSSNTDFIQLTQRLSGSKN